MLLLGGLPTSVSAQKAAPIETADTTVVTESAFPENAPMLQAGNRPKRYYIRKVEIHGVKYLDHNILKSSAGLIEGDSIYLPSDFIANSIDRLWRQSAFSDVKIGAEIEGDDLDLHVFLKERPRIYHWEFEGISKGKKKDLLEKLKLKPGRNTLSDYIIDKNKKLIKAYWVEKGFRNAEGDVRIENDSVYP
ncbi:MAG: outer membrane protein assembly factor BamA, partial [Alistipes sp.]|nr:outer membrane protein assembly factor BamA [Alistipes sp.]